jgi:hypothetical protein
MTILDRLKVVQVSSLPHINDVVPLSDEDQACLREVREVLEKHHRQSRFGIALLHKHFNLDADELLVEHCDAAQRVLTTRPRKQSELGDTPLIRTIFAFDKELERDCQPYCPTDARGRHQGRKDHG